MLTRHDVGHRVTIRRVITPDGAGHTHTELVGRLVDYTDADLVVDTRRGIFRVPHDSVTAARRIPSQRRFSRTGQLELIAANGWPATDVSPLGDWLLRAAGGWTARANSALAVGSPEMPIEKAVETVSNWYTARGLRPAIMVPDPIGGRLTAHLRPIGWHADPSVRFMTTALASLASEAVSATTPLPSPVILDTAAPPAWLAVVAEQDRGLPPEGLRVLTGVPTSRYAGVYRPDGSALAIGRGVIASDGRWLGLSALLVAEEARRTGIATAILRALADWAVSGGASDAYLQVVEGNTGAIALYDRLGFTQHHTYTTWRARSA